MCVLPNIILILKLGSKDVLQLIFLSEKFLLIICFHFDYNIKLINKPIVDGENDHLMSYC